MKNDTYGIDQIQVLHGLEPVRMRPGMYIGSTSQSGIDQLIYEIVDNSVDEHTSGFGDIIDVHVYKDGRVIVSDKGRGIPCEVSDKFKDDNGNILNSLTGIMTTLHAGGKFGASGGYKNSSGLHGVGGACVNALSDSFIVTVHRDGNIYQQNFSKGKPTSDVDIIGHCDDTGTIVEYIPDKTIFKQTILPSERVAKRLRELAFLNKGLHIHYINDVSLIDEEYYFENGILGYVNQMVANKPKLYDEPFYIMDNWMDADGHNVICELAFINTDEEESVTKIKAFANNINNYEGGFHLQGFKNAYKDIVNQYALDKKTIKSPIEMQYVLDGVYAIVNVKIYNPEFEGQTKNKLGNKEAQDAVEAVMKDFFAKALRKRSVQQCFDIIVNRAVKVKESELAARKARALSRKLKKTTMLARPEKLADCSSSSLVREIWLCEGDSAAGGLKNARDTRFQAVLPLRGKLLNTNSADIDKVLSSESVSIIVASLGCGLGKSFNVDSIHYDKIIVAADEDFDGYHIAALVLTLFYSHMPGLIESGRVYRLKSPLYRITLKNEERIYLYTESELKEYKAKYPMEKYKYTVHRHKGLGAISEEDMREIIMNPQKRILKRVYIEDAIAIKETFNTLMGKNAGLRRDFIQAHSNEVDIDAFL